MISPLIDSERFLTVVVLLHGIYIGHFRATFRDLALLPSSSYCHMTYGFYLLISFYRLGDAVESLYFF